MVGFDLGLVMVSLLLGLRHGADLDHLAAIADITSCQPSTRRALELSTVYAVGHALVVVIVGAAVLVAGARLPDGVDAAMRRVVGLTLLALGVYVVVTMARYGTAARLQARGMIALRAVRRTIGWLQRRPAAIVVEHDHVHEHHPGDHHHDPEGGDGGHHHGHVALRGSLRGNVIAATATHRHTHRHAVTAPEDPLGDYSRSTCFGIGAIHGVGAETPTQVAVFVSAMGVGSVAGVFWVLLPFTLGLLASNTAIAVAVRVGLRSSAGIVAYVALALLGAAASLWLGTLYLLGSG